MKGASDHRFDLVDPSDSRSSRLPSPFDTTLHNDFLQGVSTSSCNVSKISSGFGHEIVSKHLFGCISSRTLMFDLFIYQEMRNIRRQHHISKEVILDWSAFVNVQDSHPYVAIGKISAETRRFFVALVMPLSVQILFRPTIADLAIAIRLRSSVEQPLLVVISDPRKLNCVTCSTSVPSTTIGSSFPSLPTIMILVLLTFSRRPRASFWLSQ